LCLLIPGKTGNSPYPPAPRNLDVISAQAGIRCPHASHVPLHFKRYRHWIPACAGMTSRDFVVYRQDLSQGDTYALSKVDVILIKPFARTVTFLA
jgi:hypothetical protein